eukprot:202913_1
MFIHQVKFSRTYSVGKKNNESLSGSFNLLTAYRSKDVYVVETRNLFTRAIQRAKSLFIREMGMSVARAGILQNVSFIHPAVYAELVDCWCWVIYHALYLEFLMKNGSTSGLTPGKLKGLCDDLRIPVRVYDTFISILSPVLLGKYLFFPHADLVRCKGFNLEDSAYSLGTIIGPIRDLGIRYGVPIRPGHVMITNAMSGNFVVPDIMPPEKISPVMRILTFTPCEGIANAIVYPNVPRSKAQRDCTFEPTPPMLFNDRPIPSEQIKDKFFEVAALYYSIAEVP